MDTLVDANEVIVIDLSKIIDSEQLLKTDEEVSKLSDQLKDAFSNNKLAYVINHGISEVETRNMYSLMKKFFSLSDEIKERYQSPGKSDFHGFIPRNTERVFGPNVEEIRESYNFLGYHREFPDKEIPEFSQSVKNLSEKFLKISKLLLQMLAIGLDLNSDFFLKCHGHIMRDQTKNTSIYRVLYYPPVEQEPHPGIVRCSEHTDFGTFTLLMQDSEGGLEIKDGNEKWKRAGHLPGAVILNTAGLLEIWTSGEYKATVHRVVVPEETDIRGRSRYSMAFFVQPDSDTVVKSLFPSSGGETKECIASEYIGNRIKEYYQ